MTNQKRNFLISGFLLAIAIIFTILVKIVDVQQIGPNETSIGFSTLNQTIFQSIGVNTVWYNITEILGFVAIFIAISYASIGLIQLIKRKSIFKVDKEIILLGAFYIIIVAIYLFFEKVIINYRPILTDGLIEASYPSSHTLMTICICGSSILINKKLFNNKLIKIINILLFIILALTVVGRLISGVHWFTDIIGGIIISSTLLMTFYSLLNMSKKD